MALEKFIRGKVDSCKHDGLYSNRKREQQADFHFQHWQEEVVMQLGIEYTVSNETHNDSQKQIYVATSTTAE